MTLDTLIQNCTNIVHHLGCLEATVDKQNKNIDCLASFHLTFNTKRQIATIVAWRWSNPIEPLYYGKRPLEILHFSCYSSAIVACFRGSSISVFYMSNCFWAKEHGPFQYWIYLNMFVVYTRCIGSSYRGSYRMQFYLSTWFSVTF